MLDKVPIESPYRTQLASYSSLVQSYSVNIEVLISRCRTLSQFVVNSIGIRNQVNTQTQNEVMLRINRVLVRDSASIKVITIVTLVYLPASFVAVSLSNNFSRPWPLVLIPCLDFFRNAVLPAFSRIAVVVLWRGGASYRCDCYGLVVVFAYGEEKDRRSSNGS
jgi:hypothetical protein